MKACSYLSIVEFLVIRAAEAAFLEVLIVLLLGISLFGFIDIHTDVCDLHSIRFGFCVGSNSCGQEISHRGLC